MKKNGPQSSKLTGKEKRLGRRQGPCRLGPKESKPPQSLPIHIVLSALWKSLFVCVCILRQQRDQMVFATPQDSPSIFKREGERGRHRQRLGLHSPSGMRA